MVIINIILNIILIPKDIQSLNLELAGLGGIGAAIATVISFAIGLIYTRFMIYKYTKIKGNIRILIHIFSGLLMLLILYLLLFFHFYKY